MRILTTLLIAFPVGALAFHTVSTLTATLITILFAFGVTELVNLVYAHKKENH